ncbi:hypothetical protein SAMD00023353_1200400 [Rosellinia necatrix]|uniref:Subtelomeric hrmA-associated cluster protein AFUB-079030/YDR124W-like helical bundle domain-containing protein n=1 Tax=Rosellinia necatrix TaxID=77044 RepID=A0A1W2TLR5_ROSNE|nr:hypothetical protein SAMD00023353_1200400 [Rosellinia necatrix]
MVNNPYPRDQFPQPAPWCPERVEGKYYPDDGRLTEPSEVRKGNMSLGDFLRESYGLTGSMFFVAVEQNGKAIYLSTPTGLSETHERFFDEAAFIAEVNRTQLGDNTPASDDSKLNAGTEVGACSPAANKRGGRHRHHRSNRALNRYANRGNRRSKKRPRAGRTRNAPRGRQAAMPIVPIQPRRSIMIGDSDALYAFYDNYFRCCQQTACKTIAKAWIKIVAPKKQSTHPYTRGDKSRPDWWPKVYFNVGEETRHKLPHREPDHIGRDERVFLLCHILRMVIEPRSTQHPAIRSQELSVRVLETVTTEALSSWFADRDCPRNLNKQCFLTEIFRIARQEERFRDGEIDSFTEVFIMSASDYEANKESASESDDEGPQDLEFTPASSAEPNDSQIMMPQAQAHDHSQTGNFSGTNFPDNVDMRAAHYPHPSFEHGMPERPNFVQTSDLGNHAPNYGHNHLGVHEMYSSGPATSRRPSTFSSPSEYSNAASPAVYSTWPAPNTPTNQPMYGFPPQLPSVQGFSGQIAQGSSYVPSSIDGLPRPDVQHGAVFASRSVGQSIMQHTSGYSNYLTEAPLVGSSIKTESEHHHAMMHGLTSRARVDTTHGG